MLGIYKFFFNQMHDEGINYCSWKNNHTLGRALSGDSDVDLLVSSTQFKKFEKIAFENGFIRVKSSISEYPFVQHYYCYDERSNKFGHLHVYYKLVTGDRDRKSVV